MKKLLRSLYWSAHASRHEVEIMYFGNASEALMMTSERMEIRNDTSSIGQVLHRLRERGSRWAHVLDEHNVICTVNGKTALLSDSIAAGDEIGIFCARSPYAVSEVS
ncbi:MAG: MoaD/ThiS family protein [Nitrosomonadales bacterium]|nr:MoaD/ThiS family protein [Nitrosomonadales bacterium]